MPYPTVPSRRMAWDDDGSQLVSWNGSISTPTDIVANQNAHRTRLNSEAGQYSETLGTYVGIFFPEPREVDGMFCMVETNSNTLYGTGMNSVEASSDTTNFIDGSWTQVFADYADPADNGVDAYRNYIRSSAEASRRAIRLSHSRNYGAGTNRALTFWHVYGEISPGETPDRLLWVDNATGLEFTLPIDYGDVPRGSASDRAIKLRNNSGSLTASTIQVTAESLYLNSGNWYTFNEGSGFQATLPLASSIGAGADSPVITVRRVIPDSEQVQVHSARAQVTVGSWA